MMQLQRSLGNQAGGHGLCQPKAGLRPGRAYAVRTRAARGGHDDEPIRPQGSLRSPARDLHQHLTRPGGGPIGGMHGEGFEAPYSMHHRTRMLDVDALNDSMRWAGGDARLSRTLTEHACIAPPWHASTSACHALLLPPLLAHRYTGAARLRNVQAPDQVCARVSEGSFAQPEDAPPGMPLPGCPGHPPSLSHVRPTRNSSSHRPLA